MTKKKTQTAKTPVANRKRLADLPAAKKAELVRESLEAKNIAALAHSNGVSAQSLYGWRAQARDGQLKVSAAVRKRLKAEIRGTAFVRAAHGPRTRLTRAQAAKAVALSVRKNGDRDRVLARYGICASTLSNYRAQARDGLLPVSETVRAKLGVPADMTQVAKASPVPQPAPVASETPAPKKAPKKRAADVRKTPIIDQLMAASKPKDRPVHRAKIAAPVEAAAPAKAVPSETSGQIVVSKGDTTIAFPAETTASKIAEVIGVVMAA